MPNNRAFKSCAFFHPNVICKVHVTRSSYSYFRAQRSSQEMGSVTWSAATHESLIGPPSELIHIDDFLRGARDSAALPSDHPGHVDDDESIDPVPQDPIASECR